jgi:homoserine O-acetyltransferase
MSVSEAKHLAAMDGCVGSVETQYYTFAHPPNELKLECGKSLGPVTLAYETYGRLNADKSNAILVCHALSGDAHAAGLHEGEDNPGWWEDMIGPGKAFDTERYFVICSNVIGGCKGSTGPSSITNTGRLMPSIPHDHRCRHGQCPAASSAISASGNSVAAAAPWAACRFNLILPIPKGFARPSHCHGPEASPPAIAFNEVVRQSIMADPVWRQGTSTVTSRPGACRRAHDRAHHLRGDQPLEKFSEAEAGTGFKFGMISRWRIPALWGDAFVKRFDANSISTCRHRCSDLSNGRLVLRETVDTAFSDLSSPTGSTPPINPRRSSAS